MFNYLKSEFYRIVRLKSVYFTFAFCAAITLLFNGALFYFRNEEGFRYATTKYSFSAIYTSMPILIYIVYMVCSVVIDDEFKSRTLKNSVAAGAKRNTIYFGRFIMELVIGVIFYVLINGFHIVLGLALLENSGSEYLHIFIRSLIACLPIYMACTAICHCLYYILDNAINVIFVFVVIVTLIPKAIGLAGMKISFLSKINDWLLTSMLEPKWDEAYNLTLSWDTTNGFIRCYIAGIIGIIVFSMVGSILFNKKELK
jgi:ABC-2 type transport system permease protein